MIRVTFTNKDLELETIDRSLLSDAIIDVSSLAREGQLLEVLDVISITSMGVEDIKLSFLSELKP